MPVYAHQVFIASLICTLVAGCDRRDTTAKSSTWTPATTEPVSSTQPAARGPEYLNVLEAVFRYQFDLDASDNRRDVDYLFLTLDKADPPQELIVRFTDVKPTVLPASMAKASAKEGVKHKELGGRGLIFGISSITWLDANTADVVGGYYAAELAAAGYNYRVERRGSKWVVVKIQLRSVS